MQRFIMCVLLLCFLHAQPLEETLQKVYRDHDMVGMSVIVTAKNKIVFRGHYGFREVSQKLPVTDNTVYRIASISKMITATALMQLFEREKFQLDDDISKYLGYKVVHPHFSGEKITFRRLLAHTSGLRDSKAYYTFLREGSSASLRDFLCEDGEYFSKDLFDNKNKPGYFKYANINYGVIASLVEVLAKQRFDEYCQEHIFTPLKISASFNIHTLKKLHEIATLYRYKNNAWQAQADHFNGEYPTKKDLSQYTLGTNGFLFAPQGGLRISAKNLATLMMFYYDKNTNNVLHSSTKELMYKIVWQYDKNNGDNYYGIFNSYALGNHTTTDLIANERLTGHPGEAYGLISDMYFSQEKQFGVIFISNGAKEWKKGKYSGWYLVEESVFQHCYAFVCKYLKKSEF